MTFFLSPTDLALKVVLLTLAVILLQVVRKMLITNNPFISYMEEKAGKKLINCLFLLVTTVLAGVILT